MNIYIIPEKNEMMGKCAYCGKYDELRPYGKNGATICFECGMKDLQETERQFLKNFEDEAS